MENSLIQFIKKNPCLYDKNHKSYKKFWVRDRKFAELAKELNVQPKILKERWRSLRDRDRFKSDATSDRWTESLSFLNDVDSTNYETEKLIELIKENPILYDKRHGSYKNHWQREKKFTELAQELSIPAKAFKARWQTIRNKFMRNKKLGKTEWKWTEKLSFLNNADSTNHETERLIQFVKENPFLYDKSHESYKNLWLREQKFTELSEELNIPAKAIKARWRSLRDRFIRDNQQKSEWKWAENLSFLNHEKRDRRKSCAVEEKLIQFVKENPFLYDKNHESYRNYTLRDKKFTELSEELNIPTQTLKQRWRTLRDNFVQYNKQNAKSEWKWKNSLSFLNNVVMCDSRESPKVWSRRESAESQLFFNGKDSIKYEICNEALEDSNNSSSFFESSNFTLEQECKEMVFVSTWESLVNPDKRVKHEISTSPYAMEEVDREHITTPIAAIMTSQQYFEMMAKEVNALNLTSIEFSMLQVELQKVFQNFIKNKL